MFGLNSIVALESIVSFTTYKKRTKEAMLSTLIGKKIGPSDKHSQ